MKTLTELSGSAIRMAAAAIDEARRSLPREEPSAPPAPPAQDAAASSEAPAPAAASREASVAPAAPPPATPPAAHAAKALPEAESSVAKEAIDAAVAKATGVSSDRLTMLLGAIEAAGRRAADVRLVRVFGPDEQVNGATKIGGYQYVVDLFPASMKQVAAPKEERGGRRGGGGGRGGGRGGGDRGTKGAGVGGFSMDSLRYDRKNERGGRGGPGRGRRSGGGGEAGCAPKK